MDEPCVKSIIVSFSQLFCFTCSEAKWIYEVFLSSNNMLFGRHISIVSILKCYSQILCVPKILDFGYFVYWFGSNLITSKKSWSRVARTCLFGQNSNCLINFVWLIIGSDNIFNIEVNGASAIHVDVHNPLNPNRNRLKFWT